MLIFIFVALLNWWMHLIGDAIGILVGLTGWLMI